MINLVNLTPHAINIVNTDDSTTTIPVSGKIARVDSTVVNIGSINDIPLVRTVFGNVIDLPDPVDDTIYIVSTMVLNRVPDRLDVVSPANLVRDDSGLVVGAGALTVGSL